MLDDIPEVEATTIYGQIRGGMVAVLDVRESSEWDAGHIEGATHIPLHRLPSQLGQLDPNKKWVCVCLSGVRSYYATAFLRQAGYDATNLAGGMLEWQSARLPITDPGIVLGH